DGEVVHGWLSSGWCRNRIARHYLPVIASEAKQSISTREERMDCFASLAMTVEDQLAFGRYAAKNTRVALSTTVAIRSGEGDGAAWKMNAWNSVAWHICMNCQAAS